MLVMMGCLMKRMFMMIMLMFMMMVMIVSMM